MTTTLAPPIDLLWLEITGRCQLACSHCYADSGPTGGHGSMTAADWARVIDDAAAVGVRRITMIGGEPTLHPELPGLVGQALNAGLTVEIYSNLLRVPDRLWPTLMRPGVSIATSYYASLPQEHDRITGRPGSWAQTRASIVEVLRRGIPLRVGLVGDGASADAAHSSLLALGVTTISRDGFRGLGRAAPADAPADPAQLCGRCGDRRAAVLPDGTLAACVMGRHLTAGNVLAASLRELLGAPEWAELRTAVPSTGSMCDPDGSDCSPASERACTPDYDDAGV